MHLRFLQLMALCSHSMATMGFCLVPPGTCSEGSRAAGLGQRCTQPCPWPSPAQGNGEGQNIWDEPTLPGSLLPLLHQKQLGLRDR